MGASLINHEQLGHKQGIELWSNSACQGGLDANDSDIDRGGEVGIVGKERDSLPI